jgi:hypothetical protein
MRPWAGGVNAATSEADAASANCAETIGLIIPVISPEQAVI